MTKTIAFHQAMIRRATAVADRLDEFIVDFDQLAPDYGIRHSKKHIWRLIREGRFPRSLPDQGRMSFTHGALIGHLRGLQKSADKG